MMKKFKKITKFETELPSLSSVTIQRRNKQLKASFEVEGDSIDSLIEDYDTFLKLSELEGATIHNTSIIRGKVIGGRYGSVISINEITNWSLELIARHRSLKSGKKQSISMVIDMFLGTLKSTSFTSKNVADRPHLRKNLSDYLTEDIKDLYRIFYVEYPDYFINDEDGNPVTSEEFLEVFIPDITYHPIPIIRLLYLLLFAPKLLNHFDLELLSHVHLLSPIIGFDWWNPAEGYHPPPEELQKSLQVNGYDFKKLSEKSWDLYLKVKDLSKAELGDLVLNQRELKSSYKSLLNSVSMISSIDMQEMAAAKERFETLCQLSLKAGKLIIE